MFQLVLFINLLTVHYTTQNSLEVHSDCNKDVLLQCSSVDSDLMDFLAVTWYKVNNQKHEGIIRKQKDNDLTQRYNFPREANFGERNGLFLPRVMPADSATYKCDISANVGGKNKENKVHLIVQECVTSAGPTTKATEQQQNTTNPVLHVQNLPIAWSLTGYVILAFVKILLSTICIQVIRVISSRRQKNVWSR